MVVNFSLRAFTEDDIPDIVAIANMEAEREGEEGRLSEEMLRYMIQAPYINAEEDFKIVLDGDGDIIGVTLAIVNPRTGMSQADIIINPDIPAKDIKPQLIDLALDSVYKRGVAVVPEDKPIYVIMGVKDTKVDEIALREAAGFMENRRFYEMRIDLTEPIPAPDFPEGLELRPFDPETQGPVVHMAQQESFRDHWGHAEDRPYEEWEHQMSAPSFDPELWFILWDVEQNDVAGVSLCGVNQEIPDMASVNLLGVRRPWRKRGLGMALLRQSFHTFQQKGFNRASLGVDAASKTNAVALYENAGMHVHRCTVILRKILRGNAEDIIE